MDHRGRSGATRHLPAVTPCVQLDKTRVVRDGHYSERLARRSAAGLRARTAFAIESRKRLFEAPARVSRRGRTTGGIHRLVRLRLRDAAVFQNPLEQESSRDGTKEERQRALRGGDELGDGIAI